MRVTVLTNIYGGCNIVLHNGFEQPIAILSEEAWAALLKDVDSEIRAAQSDVAFLNDDGHMEAEDGTVFLRQPKQKGKTDANAARD